MFSGVMALCERSLRVDARAWPPHLARCALMIGIFAAVCVTQYSLSFVGAPGLLFYQKILYLNLFFMTLLGIAFFSTVITEEKEEDTLGLMLMAGISPLGILLGKSIGPLIQAMLLIAVQYPFTLLAVTMGGIQTSQVRSGYAALLAYLVMLSGIGLYCSTISARNRSAAFRMTVYLSCYFAIPGLCQTAIATVGPQALPHVFSEWVGGSCVYLQVGAILSSNSTESILSHQVLTNTAIGLLGYLGAWLSFNQTSNIPATEAVSRGLLTKNRGWSRFASPGRPVFEPLIWKDFHFIAGGLPGIAIRCVIFTLLYAVTVLLVEGVFGWTRQASSREITSTYLALLSIAITIDAGLLAARTLHEEVRHQTLSALMMLPRPTGLVLYPKYLGTILGWLPGFLFLIAGFFVLQDGPQVCWEFFSRGGPPFLFIAFYVLVPHAAAVAALYVRWGAFPVGIALTVAAIFLASVVINVFHIGPMHTMVYPIGMAIYALSVCCHVIIWLKTEQHACR